MHKYIYKYTYVLYIHEHIRVLPPRKLAILGGGGGIFQNNTATHVLAPQHSVHTVFTQYSSSWTQYSSSWHIFSMFYHNVSSFSVLMSVAVRSTLQHRVHTMFTVF